MVKAVTIAMTIAMKKIASNKDIVLILHIAFLNTVPLGPHNLVLLECDIKMKQLIDL